MNLSEVPFRKIKDGIKTLEIRLFDDKRKTFEVGDVITFSCNNERITVEIFGLSRFANFYELFALLGGECAGWSDKDTIENKVQDMRKYYSVEDEKRFGVLGIHVKLVDNK